MPRALRRIFLERLRRHGAITFGPHPRDYRQQIPRKMRRLAMRCVLSAKTGEGRKEIWDRLLSLMKAEGSPGHRL